jgi:hypothetical protein
VCDELKLALQSFAWEPAMGVAGVQESALYVVRPDGYVALADPTADPARLRGYFNKRGLRSRL